MSAIGRRDECWNDDLTAQQPLLLYIDDMGPGPSPPPHWALVPPIFRRFRLPKRASNYPIMSPITRIAWAHQNPALEPSDNSFYSLAPLDFCIFPA